MRTLLPIVRTLGALLVPAVATAGPIYGTILFNDAALKGGASSWIELGKVCPS